jgi:tetratricopeptide (TPR) repeat protein
MKNPFVIFPFCLAGWLHGQVYTPPPAAGPSNAPPADVAPPPASKPPAASPLGQEIPLLDPSAETITVGGVVIPLGDNRLLKARFEKYLSQPPETDEDAAEYRENIANILGTISPFRSGGPDLYAAFKLLPAASSYPGDANLCGSLAESIYMAMLSKQDVKGLQRLNQAIEEEKQAIIAEGDWKARHERDKALDEAPRQRGGGGQGGGPAQRGGGNNRQTQTGAGTQSLRYAETLRRITEIEAIKKANIARTEAQVIRTKAQYQVTMVQWFVQRRYEHVLMAARFYNQIWKDGDATLRINKNSDVSKLFSESVGVSPTVSSLDSLSNEAIREVGKYVEAFDLMLSRDELHSASQRLMEAFALGEYLAPVATLPIEKKRRVADYVRDLHELYGTLQARDYTKAIELANRLKANAKDFPSSKVDSAIAAYTLASDLAIEEAKAHLISRDSDKAAEKIRAATEIWPTNPKLDEFRSLVSSSSAIVTARNDFDRLLSEGNYREIARRQYEFAPVIQGDAAREDAFRQIMTNLTKIETALGKASEFSKVGQNYAAWEQLAELREQFPDDPKLGRELELLAPKVADFTLALDKASQFEKRVPKQVGSAMSWYLKARSIHPQSVMAETGIQRLLDEIIPGETSGTAASRVGGESQDDMPW